MPAADRRQAILAAALDVFSERGFHEAALEDVAARDGISKALIYEHFRSKGHLQRALIETYVHELLERILSATTTAEPGEDRLRRGIEAFLGFVEERRDAWRMLFRNLADPEMVEALERLRAEVAAGIAQLMVEDARQRERNDPEMEQAADVLALQLVGAVQSLANWWNDHPGVPHDRVLELAMDFAWIGLGRLGDGERWRAAGPS
jgi:AcrR family transcriptional regulator